MKYTICHLLCWFECERVLDCEHTHTVTTGSFIFTCGMQHYWANRVCDTLFWHLYWSPLNSWPIKPCVIVSLYPKCHHVMIKSHQMRDIFHLRWCFGCLSWLSIAKGDVTAYKTPCRKWKRFEQQRLDIWNVCFWQSDARIVFSFFPPPPLIYLCSSWIMCFGIKSII